MRRLFLFLGGLFFALTAMSATANYEVVPRPNNIQLLKGAPFLLDNTVQILCEQSDSDLVRNARFLQSYIEEAMGLRLHISSQREKRRRYIELRTGQTHLADEGYTLVVNAEDGILIKGATPQGVFHGVQTLRKSLPLGAPSAELPPVEITDSPRFAYRGMHLDCSRHFFSIDFVKQYIDMLALHQLNVFHWHLTDDQGWRLEIKSWPRLTEVGSRRSGTVIGRNSDLDDHQPIEGYYTQQQAREIVDYARQRYITVIPEIDMPGHMLAALASYPELGCTGGPYEVGHWWGVYSDVLCAGNERVYQFVDDVLREVADVFPSEIIHIGGDEAPTLKWDACPRCQQIKGPQGLSTQGYFTQRVMTTLQRLNRRAMGWDELLDNQAPPSTMIMSWRGVEPGARAAVQGHDVVMTPLDYCYLNFQQAEDTWHEPSQCDGYIPIQRLYGFDPCPDSLSVEARSHILGVQANLWAEYLTSPSLAQYQLLPRLSALSEVQWTQPAAKDYDDFVARLTRLTAFYELLHWDYARHLWPDRRLKSRGEF